MNLTTYEMVIIFSMFLQCLVLILAMIAYGHIPDKLAWKWFIFAAILVLIRRFISVFELAMQVDTNLIETSITIIISTLWIKYIWDRTDGLKG